MTVPDDPAETDDRFELDALARPDPESEVLLAHFAAGSDAALAGLIDKERPYLRRHLERRAPRGLMRRLGISDIIQQVSIELLGLRENFENRGYGAFRVLLFRIADGLLVNALKREHAGRRSLHREVELSSDPCRQPRERESPEARPSETLQSRERVEAMKRCLVRLVDADREAIRLIDYERLSHEEAARRLGLRTETMRKRYSRALARLREKMLQEGLE